MDAGFSLSMVFEEHARFRNMQTAPKMVLLGLGLETQIFFFFLECEAVEKSNTSWKTDDGTWMHMDLATDVR